MNCKNVIFYHVNKKFHYSIDEVENVFTENIENAHFWQDCAYIWKKEVLVLVSTTVPTFQMAAHIHLILLKPYIPVRLKFDSRKFL